MERLVAKFTWILSCTVAAILTSSSQAAPHPQMGYVRTNLVSNGGVPAVHTDVNLVNAWGIAFNPTGFVWVSDAESSVSTLYDGLGVPQSLVVSIPGPPGSKEGGHPTGIVFSGGTGFVVTKGTLSGPSRFLFATEDGTIAGWSPAVDMTNAILAVDNSDSEANYKGLAMVTIGPASFLFATDFHNAKVDVFDANFMPVMPPGGFEEPMLPPGFAPFGMANIGGALFVSYAMQDKEAEDDVTGYGLGFVDVFDTDGNLLRRFAMRGHLNAPWGMALAPSNFGMFSNAVLIGNFGDGRINAFDPVNGKFLGMLRDQRRRPIEIEGLWGIAFGNGFNNQPPNTLFFAAGPNDEEDGLYGRIDWTAP